MKRQRKATISSPLKDRIGAELDSICQPIGIYWRGTLRILQRTAEAREANVTLFQTDPVRELLCCSGVMPE